MPTEDTQNNASQASTPETITTTTAAPAPTTGNYMFDLRDSSWNANRAVQIDYEYAGIYDITDLDGKIVDIAHPLNTINIHKGFSVWTDSLGTYPFVSRLREYFGHVNSFAVSNANAGYVAPGANIAGGETSVQILSNFQANPEQFGNSTIIWAGHNNISPTSVVLANVASMVAQLTGEYRVFSLLYNTTWNGTQRGYVDTINAGFASAYGNRYVDVKAALIAAANGQAGDMTDAAAGNVPRSCRVDSIHINRRGIEIVADAFHASCLGGF